MSIDQDKGFFYSLQLKRNGVDQSQWPQLTCSKANQLAVSGGFTVDPDNTNDGSLHPTIINDELKPNPSIIFGQTSDDPNVPQSGEGIASKRTSGGNQNGLDFYTGSTARLSITNVGNVGIGTLNPGSPLEISSKQDAILRLRRNEAGHPWNYIEWYNNTSRLWWSGTTPNNSFSIGTDLGGGQVLSLTTSGNVGIGIAAPTNKLHVVGAGPVTIENAGEADILFKDTSHDQQWQVGTNEQGWYVYDNTYRLVVNKGSGNVGIGMVSPSQKLEVNGTVKATALEVTGLVKVNGQPVIDSDAGWHRSYGNAGWYNGTYGGGWYMEDSTWIRSYGAKNIYHDSGILRTDGTLQVGPNGNRFVVNTSGNVGIGTTGPQARLHANTTNGIAVYGFSNNSVGVSGASDSDVGVVGYSAKSWAAIFWGKVYVSGLLSKGGGGFKIDHPLEPRDKYLSHSFVESPDMKNIYDGVAVLDANGEAVIELPNWFEALNTDFRYQLTCIGGYAPVYIAQEIEGNRFKIAGGNSGMKVSWQVTGIRQDAWANDYRIPVEEEKPDEERGYYLHPVSHGESEERSIHWALYPNMMQQTQ